MGYYKGTKTQRALITSEARVILPPDVNAPDGGFRYVQVCIPSGAPVCLHVGSGDTPKQALSDQEFEGFLYGVDNMPADPSAIGFVQAAVSWPLFDGDQTYCFGLLPDQWLAAATTEGDCRLSLIIEYQVD